MITKYSYEKNRLFKIKVSPLFGPKYVLEPYQAYVGKIFLG